MSESTPSNSPEAEAAKAAAEAQKERTKRVETAGWTAGLSALFLVMALSSNPTWPLAVGVIAVAAMVAGACYFMLK